MFKIIVKVLVAALFLLCVVVGTTAEQQRFRFIPAAAGGGEPECGGSGLHDFFQCMMERADCWFAADLRPDPGQTSEPDEGCADEDWSGQLSAQAGNDWGQYDNTESKITYVFGSDPHSEAQDAGKVTIAPFSDVDVISEAALAADVEDTMTTTITLNGVSDGLYGVPGKHWKIDDEIVEVVTYDNGTNIGTVIRGQKGTSAAMHTSGTTVLPSNNNLESYVNIPFPGTGTSDGNDYIFFIDVYHPAEWKYATSGLAHHKTFNWLTDDPPGIWFEPHNSFIDDIEGGGGCNTTTTVGSVAVRPYNFDGGEADWTMSSGDELGPNADRLSSEMIAAAGQNPVVFCEPVSEWLRWGCMLKQRVNDYDLATCRVRSEGATPSTLLFTDLQLSVSRASLDDVMTFFEVEFNTSTDGIPASVPVSHYAYVRDFVALKATAGTLTTSTLQSLMDDNLVIGD